MDKLEVKISAWLGNLGARGGRNWSQITHGVWDVGKDPLATQVPAVPCSHHIRCSAYLLGHWVVHDGGQKPGHRLLPVLRHPGWDLVMFAVSDFLMLLKQ